MLRIDVPEAEYIVFEHGPFSYDQENISVEEKVKTAMSGFDFTDTTYCLDDSTGRMAYFFHDPEQFWKYVWPVRKK
mgnify:CR=1 FL=1